MCVSYISYLLVSSDFTSISTVIIGLHFQSQESS